MDVGHLLQVVFSLFILPLIVLPTLGGGFVTLGFQISKLPAVNFWRCWKIYLASCCYAFLALVPLRVILPANAVSPMARNFIHLGIFCGMQLILVPIFLRKFSARALAITGAAILLANLVTIVVVWEYNQA
jgi:hypothetical protein